MRFCTFVKSHSDVCIKLQETFIIARSCIMVYKVTITRSKFTIVRYTVILHCKKLHFAFQHTTSCCGLHSVFNLIDIRPGQKIFVCLKYDRPFYDMTEDSLHGSFKVPMKSLLTGESSLLLVHFLFYFF